MATAAPAQPEPTSEPDIPAVARWSRVRRWLRHDAIYLLGSMLFHVLLLVAIGLISVRVVPKIRDEAPSFDAESAQTPNDAPPEHFEVAETPLEPSELSTETLTLPAPAQLEQAEQKNDDNPIFTERGGGTPNGLEGTLPGMPGLIGDPNALGSGPASSGFGLGGNGKGTGHSPGIGGSGTGFGGRGTGMRKALVGRYGGTKQSERAVAAALNWLARHQMPNGSWSLGQYPTQCKDQSCTGTGSLEEAGAATALGLLPFLAAGQTHQSQGPYRKTIHGGLVWLMRHQGADGDLRMGATMYSHGIATIALCEAAALSRDSTVAHAAQKAIDFIEAAQHPQTGGWRYAPRSLGDTSVLGWQVMALKSAQMAGLRVEPRVLQGTGYYLDGVASGTNQEQFAYQPGHAPGPPMTAVGLLCRQYLGMQRESPTMEAGVAYLMGILPTADDRNVYHWYYATQVIHNYSGPDWDAWNRKMRKILIDTQEREGCAAGSWNPLQPSPDAYAPEGGRLMVTSLSALTLEIYYRYLPLYKFEIGHHDASVVGHGGESAETSPPAEAIEPLEPAEVPQMAAPTAPKTPEGNTP